MSDMAVSEVEKLIIEDITKQLAEYIWSGEEDRIINGTGNKEE